VAVRISAAVAIVLAVVLAAVAGCSGGGQPGFPVGAGGDAPGNGAGDTPTTPADGGRRILNPEGVQPCEVLGKTSLTQFGLSGEPKETIIADHRGPACEVSGNTTFVDFQITQNEDVDSFREVYGKEGALTQKTVAGYDSWVYLSTRWGHCDVLINAGQFNMGYVSYARNSGVTEPNDAKLCDDAQLIATALLETIG
jgi:hypothetical protein